MKSWQEELNNIPTDKEGKKECSEQLSSSVICKFIKEEVYPRFEKVKSEFSSQDLKVKISPEFKNDVQTDNPEIIITIIKDKPRSCNYSLKFNECEDSLTLSFEFNGKKSYKNLGSISLNNPDVTKLIDSYIMDLCKTIE